jgi:hypothetical protein
VASLLTTIYATIAAQEITVNGQAVGCLDLAELRTSLESAVLPTRQLNPFNARGGGGLQTFWTMGDGVRTVDWLITDMLAWRAHAAGMGLEDIAPDLIAYTVQYVELLKQLRTRTWNVTGCQMQVLAYEYPLGSGRWWDGVICQLTIREIVQ